MSENIVNLADYREGRSSSDPVSRFQAPDSELGSLLPPRPSQVAEFPLSPERKDELATARFYELGAEVDASIRRLWPELLESRT